MTIPEGPPQRRPHSIRQAMFQYFEQLTEDANPGFENSRYVFMALFLHSETSDETRPRARMEDGVDYLSPRGKPRGKGPMTCVINQMSREEVTQLQAALHQQMEAE